jgi:hypothetical protein
MIDTQSNTELFKGLKLRAYESKYKNILAAIRQECIKEADAGKFRIFFDINDANCASYFDEANYISDISGLNINELRLVLNDFGRFMKNYYNISVVNHLQYHKHDKDQDQFWFQLVISWEKQLSKKITQTITTVE